MSTNNELLRITGQETLDLLNGGKDAFNRWRKENPFVILDLTAQNLSEIDLSGYDLSGYEGQHGEFVGTAFVILNKSILRKIDQTLLLCAEMRETDLQGASCKGFPGMGNGYLNGADLTGANCKKADFSYNSLDRVNLKDCDVEGAIFLSCGMSGLVNLEKARNVGYAKWYGAQRLNVMSKAFISRTVGYALENSWLSCYQHHDLHQLATGQY